GSGRGRMKRRGWSGVCRSGGSWTTAILRWRHLRPCPSRHRCPRFRFLPKRPPLNRSRCRSWRPSSPRRPSPPPSLQPSRSLQGAKLSRKPQRQPSRHRPPTAAGQASFSSQTNADNFRQTLAGQGYNAYVRSAEVDGKTIVRVYVGPLTSREAATRVRDELERRHQSKGMVVAYDDATRAP